jgi:hypothetical protein
VANEIVLINNTLNNDVSEASAQVVWREGERSAPVIRTFWRAKERPRGFRVMRAGLVPPGPEILYVEDVNDLKETSVPINLVEKNGFKSFWEFAPRHSRGVVCIILVLPPGKGAKFSFRPHLAKVARGRLAVYYKLRKPRKSWEAIPIAWTVREPRGSLEDEERRINGPRLWRRLVGHLRAIDTEKLVVGASTLKDVAIAIAILLVISLAVIALWQGTPARDLLIDLLNHLKELV